MSLNIYTSNRMEKLVAALAHVLRDVPASPLTPEIIVVQSKGMQRWTAMELAKRLGVWANCLYPFPNSMLWRLFGAVLPDNPNAAAFSREVLTWKIINILPVLLPREEFAALRHYLGKDKDGLQRFQLAERIADAFDQYTLFRPEMLARWEAAEETGDEWQWQAILWREIGAGSDGRHRGRLKDEFHRFLTTDFPLANPLPERLSVFGISYLPQYHMEIFASIVRFTDVNLFVLSPTREYWSDIISRREKARLTAEKSAMRIEGNPLLASLGKLGRDFSDMVVELGDGANVQEDLYIEPGEAKLLHKIQTHILNLSGAGEGVAKAPIDGDDPSIQIHSCHSPMREIEVLHDNILSMLDNEDGIAPRDILVMTPDIETYAPYISAVFDGGSEGALRIPYSIADRRLRNEGQIAAAMLKLLSLPGSRFTAALLFDLLNTAPLRKRFALADDEPAIIRSWIEKTSIRWGLDEESRIRLGLPGYGENSWRAGLDRLLLGYAMPEEGHGLFQGKLPYDDIEGADAQALGKLVEFVSKAAALAENLVEPRGLKEWEDQCRAILDDFIAADEDMARELATIKAVLSNLTELEEQAGFDGKVELSVMRAWLTERLEKEEKGLGFMTGGVTFCAMLPMRSIPFRIVALIGMSDGAFPRRNPSLGFDLIARNPRRGDRSLRDEDRYLFLEAILSARDCLYISYVGQSIKDNSEIPPSVLVSELIDAIDRAFTAGEGAAMEKRLVTRHRLQAFNRDYFTAEPPLFSYSRENYRALLEKQEGSRDAGEFMTAPLPVPSASGKEVSLPILLRFFDNPARFFLENRLGIRLEAVLAPLKEREPFSMEGLDSYALKMDLLEIILQGGNAGDFFPIARNRGMIPPARHGEFVFAALCREVEQFADALNNQFSKQKLLPPLTFDLAVEDWRLTGRLDGIRSEGMIRYRCAKLKAKDLVRAWIEHLVLNAVSEEGYPRRTSLIMTDHSTAFAPAEDARAVLATLLDMYRRGLTKPLPFFPRAAVAYAEKEKWDLNKAYGMWAPGFTGIPGEGSDPYFKLCFGRSDPFTEEFAEIARTLMTPLVRHQAREKT